MVGLAADPGKEEGKGKGGRRGELELTRRKEGFERGDSPKDGRALSLALKLKKR